MRWILVDHARARLAAKRHATMVTLADEAESQPRGLDVISIDDALKELAMADPRQAQIVELRFFGGLTHEEVASNLGMSLLTSSGSGVWRGPGCTSASPRARESTPSAE